MISLSRTFSNLRIEPWDSFLFVSFLINREESETSFLQNDDHFPVSQTFLLFYVRRYSFEKKNISFSFNSRLTLDINELFETNQKKIFNRKKHEIISNRAQGNNLTDLKI